MHMRDVWLLTARAKLVTNAIRKNPEALVASHGVADVYLDVRQKLIFCYPAVAMVDPDMTKGLGNDSSRRRSRDPET